MKWLGISLIAFLGIAFHGSAFADISSRQPRITAQGFAIETAHRAESGRFSAVRVRIEAPSRIANLLISDEDAEIDLASTTDRALFALFGLDKRPMNAFDVTLDLAPYINARLTSAATYRIGITIVDRAGQAAQSAVTVTVIGDDDTADETSGIAALRQDLKESVLTLRRQGAGPVEPVTLAPLSWVTQEGVNVTLRLRAAERGAELRQLSASSWESVFTRMSLERSVAATPAVPYVDVAAARNGAAGTVLTISTDGGNSLVYISGSSTSLSSLGTTVTLTASVRN